MIRLALYTNLLLLLACSLCAQIKKGDALFEHLTMQQGLTSNQVNCLFQDSRGFIWIGTGSGLNRYDGVEIVRYVHYPGKDGIAGNNVTSICEDKQQNLWIGTDKGVGSLNTTFNRFVNYISSPAERQQLKATQFYVAMDADGNIWATSNFHLSLFNKQQNAFTHYKLDNGENLPITRNHNVYSIFEDSRKRLWVPTSYGVQLFDRATHRFAAFRFAEKDKVAPENAVRCIKETSNKKIVAATWGGSLLLFNETTRSFEKLVLYEEAATRPNLVNIILDILPVQDKLFCATSQGLAVLEAASLVPGVCNNYTLYNYDKANPQSISSDIVNALMIDNTGTLWAAAKGISKTNTKGQTFHTQNVTLQQAPASISSVSIVNNGLLLAADDACIFKDGRTIPLGFASKIKNSYGQHVWDVCTGKNYLWLGTTNGLIKATSAGDFVKQYIHSNSDTNSVAGERIWKVYEDSKGLVWMGTVRRGISVLDPLSERITSYFSAQNSPGSLFNQYVSDFFEDAETDIWFTAGNSSLYRYNRSAAKFTVFKLTLPDGTDMGGEPTIVHETKNGQLVLVSRQGIWQFDATSQKIQFVAFHVDMGTVSDAISIYNRHYWLITATGLLHYDAASKQFKRYTTQNGLPDNEDMNALTLMPDGNILIAGLGFLSSFNPSAPGNDTNIPPIQITGVIANSKDTLYNNGSNTLPYLSGIEFHFAALSFSNATQNMYQYRLVGISNNWSQPAYERSISYAQLPPGQYRFEVMGCNADGTWSKAPAVFSFSINRPFYKTVWFYVLLLLIAGGLLYLLYRYRLSKAIELEKMRTRIATDLHDDIGATLSSISMYSDALKKQVKQQMPQLEPVLNKIGESSREMVTGMSDIVWAINPENDSGEKLLSRIENYARDMCAVNNITLHVQFDDKIKQLLLPLAIRKNLYLIFKEALNNALKYAGAKNITVSLQYSNRLTMQVADDGRGFDEATVRKGNGLKNFALRAEEMGGSLLLQSTPGTGTLVQVSCKI